MGERRHAVQCLLGVLSIAGGHNHWMDLRLLRYFVAVCDAGTMTAAAETLHVAQPSLSRQLRLLERSLGIDLFERAGPRLRLSAAGREFVPVARDLLRRAEWTQARAAELASGAVRRLTVGATPSAVDDLLSPFLATLTPADPLILAREIAPSHAHDSLRSGVDLVMTTVPARSPFAGVILVRAPVRGYVAAAHAWAVREEISLAELVQEPLILLTRDHMTRVVLDDAVAAAGLAYGRVEECEIPHAVQALAAAGFGVGVVSDRPRFGAHQVLLSQVGNRTPLCVPLFAAWDPGHYAAPVLREFARRIGRFAASTAGLERTADEG